MWIAVVLAVCALALKTNSIHQRILKHYLAVLVEGTRGALKTNSIHQRILKRRRTCRTDRTTLDPQNQLDPPEDTETPVTATGSASRWFSLKTNSIHQRILKHNNGLRPR